LQKNGGLFKKAFLPHLTHALLECLKFRREIICYVNLSETRDEWYSASSPVTEEVNYWVMHPVARVSIKYWNNLRKQQSIFSARFYCACEM
jgi:hypothetical protein